MANKCPYEGASGPALADILAFSSGAIPCAKLDGQHKLAIRLLGFCDLDHQLRKYPGRVC